MRRRHEVADLSRQAHASYLNQARENVNLLGKQLSELETLDAQGTALQQAAIREARPHLEQLADHVQTAIVTLNEERASYRFPDFGQAVNGMYRQADQPLYQGGRADGLREGLSTCGRCDRQGRDINRRTTDSHCSPAGLLCSPAPANCSERMRHD